MAANSDLDVKEPEMLTKTEIILRKASAPPLATMIAGRSIGTIQTYRNSLRSYGEHAYGTTDPDDVIRHLVAGGKGKAYLDLTAFARDQRKAGHTAGTIRMKISCIKAVAAQLHRADVIDWVPEYDRRVLHGIAVKRPTKGPSIEDAIKLITAAQTQVDRRLALRDEAILWLAISCGLRASEIVGLSVADLDLQASKISIIGKGSGGIKSSIPISPEAKEAIERWVALLYNAPPENPLFMRLDVAGPPRGHLTTQALRKIIKRHAAAAGIAHVWPHALRHTAITAVAQITRDTLKTMRFARHSSLRMTQVYLDVISSDEEQREVAGAHGKALGSLLSAATKRLANAPLVDPAEVAD